MCKTYVPKQLDEDVEKVKPEEGLEGDAKKEADNKVKEFGIAHMTAMCKQLIAGGEKHLHFYCLNVDGPTKQILKNLSYAPQDYDDSTCDKYGEARKGHRAYHTA